MDHTVELISKLKSSGIILWVHTIYKPTIFESDVHIAGYRISIGLKVVCIWQNSNLEEGGGYMTSVPRVAHYFRTWGFILWAT